MEFTTVLIAAAIYAIIWFLARKWLLCRKMPPGTALPPMPPARSLMGHVELNEPDFHCKKAIEWATQYGPVFRLRQVFTEVVVINDVESMRKFCCKNQLLDRPGIMNLGHDHYQGLSTMCGEVWAANKRFFMKMQRDLGFGTSMEKHIIDELNHLCQRIDAAKEEPLLVDQHILDCVANITASLVYGALMDGKTTARSQLNSILRKAHRILTTGQLFLFWPRLLIKLCLLLPLAGKNEISSAMKELDDFTIKQIKDYLAATCENSDHDFIRTYLKKVEESKGDPNPTFEYRYLVGNINAVILGGIFGPARSVLAHMVVLAARRHEIQDRVHQEIDEVIGPDRPPTWEDRKRMPFTIACIWEMERWHMGSFFGLPRTSDYDILVDNFFIPKGTVVLLNLWAVNNNPSHWKDPHCFDPTRYLTEDGSLIGQRPDNHVTFSVGKRSCPGEAFALMEIFLMFAFLVQRYDVLLGQPLDFDIDEKINGVRKFDHIKLRFVPRRASKTRN